MCLDPSPPQVLRIDRRHSAPREPGADARPGPRRGYKRPRALSVAAVFRSWSRTETVPAGRRSLCPSATLVASRRVAYGPMSFSPSARWMTTYQCLHTVPLDLGSVDPWHPVYAHDPASDPPPPQVLRIDRRHRRHRSRVWCGSQSSATGRCMLRLRPTRLVPVEAHRAGFAGAWSPAQRRRPVRSGLHQRMIGVGHGPFQAARLGLRPAPRPGGNPWRHLSGATGA